MATRKSTPGRKVKAPAAAGTDKEPLSQKERNERWYAKLKKDAEHGRPIPKRFNFFLSPEASEALEAIRKAHGGTKAEVITTLLLERAKKLRKST